MSLRLMALILECDMTQSIASDQKDHQRSLESDASKQLPNF
jgi:hypothetical protein